MNRDFQIMGVVNVTPDSFFDGGAHDTPGPAAAHAATLIAEGADIVDIGGESTRPGAVEVSAAEEIARVVPTIAQIRAAHPSAPISIDTMKSEVAAAAIEAGATYVNDVSAFSADPELAGLAASAGVDCCLMHMRGEPRTMQDDPQYGDVVDDVRAYLESRMTFAIAEGVSESKIQLDPGIGFGKTLAHNLELLARLDEIVAIGRPVVIGVSRKSFISRIAQDAGVSGVEVEDRLPGTIAANALALERGAQVFRVHDVRATAQGLAVAAAALASSRTRA
ncbi:MAG: dihydropteroate synthase [Thermoleophilaceae bacterium]|nr:dihydropteroate synthase [Thermoleophilaceae bacterium]